MKKILLSAAFLFVAFTGANAQQTISFEASEGFTLGDIHDQNEWSATQLPANDNNPTFTITNSLSSDGSNSFFAEGTNLQYYYQGDDPQTDPPALLGASKSVELSVDLFEVSFDIYMTNPATAGNGSDFRFHGVSVAEQFNTSILTFNFQNNVRIIDNVDGVASWITVTTFEYETWYNVRVKYDFTNGTIEYFVDDVSVYEGTVWTSATTVDRLDFQFDNYESGFYIDNIVINEDVNASTGDFTTSTFSVYPNPAKDIINISNSADVVESVTITDMNGRVVKNVTLGENEGQINIADLSQGVYILNAVSNGKSVTEKIIKR